MTHFSDLGLAAPIVSALAAKGYGTPTPIQRQAIPLILQGRDLLGIAATGTGKTAAFALPILQRLCDQRRTPVAGTCRALILSPTRELAAQIGASVAAYGRNLGVRVAVVVGGVSYGAQTAALRRGLDVLVATPGRLLDHLQRGNIRFDAVEVFVLDEADHMLDLGFIPAIRRIVRGLSPKRQNLFFSATMPREIGALASEILNDPQRVAVTPSATPAERIDQQVMFVEPGQKAALLASILRRRDHGRVLVFTRTKRGADRVVRTLAAANVGAAAIHGNKSQGQRQRALAGFRDAPRSVLVATDIAARGLDINGIGLVVNFDLPNVPETYVHRIGRTARAGAAGAAISFCGSDERPHLRAIEALTRNRIPASAANGQAVPVGEAVPVPPAARRVGRSRWKGAASVR